MDDEAARVDRRTAEEVLRRAIASRSGPAEAPDELSAAQLVAIGRELGLAEDEVRSALREVVGDAGRTRTGGLLGPVAVGERRSVPGAAADVEARLTAWLEGPDTLRRVAGGVGGGPTVWEAQGGLVGGMRSLERQLRGEAAELRRAQELRTTVRAIDGDTALVELEARLDRVRPLTGLGIGAGIAAVALVGAAIGGAAVALVAPVALLAGAAIGIAAQRAEARRLARAVERRLDALARGDEPRDAVAGIGAAASALGRAAADRLRPPRPPAPPGR